MPNKSSPSFLSYHVRIIFNKQVVHVCRRNRQRIASHMRLALVTIFLIKFIVQHGGLQTKNGRLDAITITWVNSLTLAHTTHLVQRTERTTYSKSGIRLRLGAVMRDWVNAFRIYVGAFLRIRVVGGVCMNVFSGHCGVVQRDPCGRTKTRENRSILIKNRQPHIVKLYRSETESNTGLLLLRRWHRLSLTAFNIVMSVWALG